MSGEEDLVSSISAEDEQLDELWIIIAENLGEVDSQGNSRLVGFSPRSVLLLLRECSKSSLVMDSEFASLISTTSSSEVFVERRYV